LYPGSQPSLPATLTYRVDLGIDHNDRTSVARPLLIRKAMGAGANHRGSVSLRWRRKGMTCSEDT
jgi:hypothetical protein